MTPFIRLRDRLSALDLILEESALSRSVRKGLTLSIPFLLIGSFALVIISLPVPSYERFMEGLWGMHWKDISLSAIGGTFGMLSLAMALAVSHSYVLECNEAGGGYVNPMIAALVALGSLLCLSEMGVRGPSAASFGVTGLFAALLVSVLSTRLFLALSRVRWLRIRPFADGASAAFGDALQAVLPALLTMSLFATAGFLVFRTFEVANVQQLLAGPFLALFRSLGHSLAGALLFVLLAHVFWMFGIHGGMVLEPVARELLVPAVALNHQLVALQQPPAHIFTKTFLDVFVLVGGCGATLGLVLAILLAGRRKNLRRHAVGSCLPVLFNVNELIVFGIPIVLNPVYLIPFLATPLLLTLVAYGATAAGWVPYTTREVEWTTPVLLGGYAATGSLAGSVLQAVNLVLGVACYLPFVRIADHQATVRMKRTVSRIGKVVDGPQETVGRWALTTRHDDIGMAARALASDLAHDLDQGRLELYYQPQFDHEGRITGVEALFRWQHEIYGSISPPVAIALAEETDLFGRLDGWILDTACRQLRTLLDQGLGDITVSFNTTASRLEGGAVFANLKTAIDAYRLPPGALKVEITEKEALSATHTAVARMNEIRALGVKLAMDDFGMGHTSIVYLKECIFDTVKIDGSLVTGMRDNPVCSELISTIAKLGRALSFTVVAEFVETGEQRDQLIALGCLHFQGYLYSRALPARDLPGFIQAWRAQAVSA